MVERGAAAEISRLHERNAKTTACRFVRAGETVNAAADDEQVVGNAFESRQITRAHNTGSWKL
jgi:hypothetical protein